VPVNFETGNMQGPTAQGVQCLIHEDSNGSGQDILVSASPLSITGGSNRPDGLSGVTGLTTSDSIVTVPLYDGSDLCPGGSCGPNVTIVGFLQVFVNSVDLSDVGSRCDRCPQPKTCIAAQGNVHVTVLSVAGCGSSGSTGGSSGTPLGSGGSTIPVRLIQGPG